MRCDGVRAATGQTCGSVVNRCKSCGHEGCNQGAENACSKQGFRVTRCSKCSKLGVCRPIKDESSASANS